MSRATSPCHTRYDALQLLVIFKKVSYSELLQGPALRSNRQHLATTGQVNIFTSFAYYILRHPSSAFSFSIVRIAILPSMLLEYYCTGQTQLTAPSRLKPWFRRKEVSTPNARRKQRFIDFHDYLSVLHSFLPRSLTDASVPDLPPTLPLNCPVTRSISGPPLFFFSLQNL